MESDVMGKDRQTKEEFFYYPYVSDSIDLRHIKRVVPTLKVPDFIKIDPPHFGAFQDTVVLISAIDKQENENDLIIWLAGDYSTNEVTFYIDRTLDRRFTNDGLPVIINAGDGRQKIVFKPLGKKDRRDIYLAVPPKQDIYGKYNIKKWKEKIENRISLDLMAGFGVGSINFYYDNLETGYYSNYDVNMSSKNLGVMIGYDLPKFRFAAGLQYQNLFYYTSYSRRRFGEDEIVYTSQGQQIIERVQVDRNQEVQPDNMLQFSLLAAYKIKLSQYAEIQPTFAAGITKYSDNKYLPNRVVTDEVFILDNNRFYDIGLRTEFTIGRFKAFYLGLTYNVVDWDPEGFVESLPQENFTSSFAVWRGIVGYRIGF